MDKWSARDHLEWETKGYLMYYKSTSMVNSKITHAYLSYVCVYLLIHHGVFNTNFVMLHWGVGEIVMQCNIATMFVTL